ncbi:MAG: ABC transporter ATP-binding protein [Acidobacteriia bacterium]|nr:ABC transporter ATP-binding protein [Terriglobia bacterium]
MVEAKNLTHLYGSRTALDGLSFSVAKGEIFGLLGPNGGGKSTLFRILATMMSPTSGSAHVAGFDVAAHAAQVRRRIGVVFQTQSLDRKLTVGENLTAQGHLFGFSGADLRARAEQSLEKMRLTDRRGDLVDTLSGGLKRRVEIAKALLHEPEILLMDEPSTGLDPGVRRELNDHMQELRANRGVTILLTTHILEEADRCDRLLLIHQGRRVAEGTPAELKAKVGGDVVVMESDSPVGLAEKVKVRFAVEPHVTGRQIRVEIANGHRFITEVIEAFPGAIQSIALHKPTLEDVFLDETGESIS